MRTHQRTPQIALPPGAPLRDRLLAARGADPAETDEIAMMLPFLERHVALADPEVIVLMGNTPCSAALGRMGILKLRGQWVSAFDKPAMPMTHPAYLLRNPAAKREAWADLLAVQARLRSGA